MPEPPVHKDGPELHVEDDGVASEEAQLLLQQRPLLRPGHVVTLEPWQLQASSLGLQAQALVVVLWKEARTMICSKALFKHAFFFLHFKECGETLSDFTPLPAEGQFPVRLWPVSAFAPDPGDTGCQRQEFPDAEVNESAAQLLE